MNWKCFFGHNFVYSDLKKITFKTGKTTYKRHCTKTCSRCGKVYKALGFSQESTPCYLTDTCYHRIDDEKTIWERIK